MGVVGVAQNVTETVKHDCAVAAMANELRQLVDIANAPIFAEIAGFSKEEAIKNHLFPFSLFPNSKCQSNQSWTMPFG
eukprot:13079772-Ditylum_brightwellii.AAC.1